MTAEEILIELVAMMLRALFIYLTVKQAETKNRPVAEWAVLGFLFGFFALIACYLMKPLGVEHGKE